MTNSVFSGAVALGLLFMLAMYVASTPAMLLCVCCGGAAWIANSAVEWGGSTAAFIWMLAAIASVGSFLWALAIATAKVLAL